MTVLNNFSEKIFRFFNDLAPIKLVWAAFCLIAAELLILLIADPIFYRDSAEYLAIVESFKLSHWELAFPPHLPVLYTVLAGLLTKLHIPPASALLLISGLFTALTVFPLFGVLKKMLPEKWAAWGSVLFALFPDIIHCGCAPLIDSGRFFFLTLSLHLIFSMPSNKICWGKLLALGVSYGALALVRAEGICFVALACLAHSFLLYREYFWKKTFSFRQFARTLVILGMPLAIMLLICSPRMYQMQQRTGYPCLDERAVGPLKNIAATFNSKSADVTPQAAERQSAAAPDYWQKRYWDSFFSGLNFVYLPFTVLGLILLFRRKKMTSHLWLMLGLFFLYSAFHFALKAGAGRYLLMNMVFLLPFTLTGFHFAFGELKKRNHQLAMLGYCAAILIAGIEIVRSLNNLNDKKTVEFRQAAALFPQGGILSDTSISGNQHPTILFIGVNDYGLGYYARVNLVIYSDYPARLQSQASIADLLEHGVDKKHIRHWLDDRVPDRTRFDAVVAYKRNYPVITSDKVVLQEQNIPGMKRLRFWKVIPVK